MTTITLDDALINEVIAASHAQNAQEALIKIITFSYSSINKNLRFSSNSVWLMSL